MRRPSGQAWREFFAAFFVTLLMIMPLYFAAYMLKTESGRAAEILPQQVEPVEKLPVAPASYTLLAALADSGGLCSAGLIRFDTGLMRVSVTAIPVETVLLYEQAPLTAAEIFLQRGHTGLAAALSETLSLKLAGSAAFSCEQAALALDRLGGFTFTMPEELVVEGDDGEVLLRIPAGTAPLVGDEITALLRYGQRTGQQRARLVERLLTAAMTELVREGLDERLVELYVALGDELATSIDSAGAYSLSAAAACVTEPGPPPVVCVGLPGRHIEGRFELSEDSSEQLAIWYS